MPTDRIIRSNFQVPPGPDQRIEVARLDVQAYEDLRIVAFNASDSEDAVLLRLIFDENGEAFGPLDAIILAPGADVTQTYAVPGVVVLVTAESTAGGSASGAILVFGARTGRR